MARYYQRQDRRLPSLSVPLPLDLMQKKLDDTNKKYQKNLQDASTLGAVNGESIDRYVFGDETLDRQVVNDFNKYYTGEINKLASDITQIDNNDVQGSIRDASQKIQKLKQIKDNFVNGDLAQIEKNLKLKEAYDKSIDKTKFIGREKEYLKDMALQEYEQKGSYFGDGNLSPYTNYNVPEYKDLAKTAAEIGKNTGYDIDKQTGWFDPNGDWVMTYKDGKQIRSKDYLTQSIIGSLVGDKDAKANLDLMIQSKAWDAYKNMVMNSVDKNKANAERQKIIDKEYQQLGAQSFNDLDMSTEVGRLIGGTAQTYSRKKTNYSETGKANPYVVAGGGSDIRYQGVGISEKGTPQEVTPEEITQQYKEMTGNLADIKKKLQNTDLPKVDRDELEDRKNEILKQMIIPNKVREGQFKDALGVDFNTVYNYYKNTEKYKQDLQGKTEVELKFDILNNPDKMKEVVKEAESEYITKIVNSTSGSFGNWKDTKEYKAIKKAKDFTSDTWFTSSDWEDYTQDKDPYQYNSNVFTLKGDKVGDKLVKTQQDNINTQGFFTTVTGEKIKTAKETDKDFTQNGIKTIADEVVGNEVYNRVKLNNGKSYRTPYIGGVPAMKTKAKSYWRAGLNTKTSTSSQQENKDKARLMYYLADANLSNKALDLSELPIGKSTAIKLKDKPTMVVTKVGDDEFKIQYHENGKKKEKLVKDATQVYINYGKYYDDELNSN